MLFNLLQMTTDAVEAIPQQEVMTFSLIEMAVKGGPLMIVLLILSILAIYLFGKKLWMIRQFGKIYDGFMEDIKDYLQEGKLKSAQMLCSHYNSPIARMVEAGLARTGRNTAEIQAAMENMGNIEINKLEKGLPYLATIAGGAPMIGFLGTVIGMIQAFFNMANAGNNIDITLLSSGIYTAMVTTVGGLVVGILAYFGYNYLTARISNLATMLDAATAKFLEFANGSTPKSE
ncbi:MAG: MotA/TolQ/ExbB proton channel family protein [Bacteroidales bacterium]|nr:MotA/TolQ/ExbB proton channel family protein [Candidatus Cryptobacteroides fimicaballi]